MSWQRSEAAKRKRSGSDKLAFLPPHLQHGITARVSPMCNQTTIWADCQMKSSFWLWMPTLEHHLVTRQQNLLSVGSLSILQYSWLVWVRVGHGECLQALHALWTSTGELQRAIGWNRNYKGANKSCMKINLFLMWFYAIVCYYNLYTLWKPSLYGSLKNKLHGFCVICR